MKLTVPESHAGQRLDRFLAESLDRSRRQVEMLLDAGRVRLGQHTAGPCEKGRRLAAGECLIVDSLSFDPPPCDRPLAVVDDGPEHVIVDKPTGLATHPLDLSQTETLLNRVVHRYPRIVGIGEGELRSGVVHRLDVPTSGLVFFALTQRRYASARHAFASHRADKRYLALVHGRIEQPQHVELELVIAQHRPAIVKVVDPAEAHSSPRHARHQKQARRCRLAFTPVEMLPRATLLDVALDTGFLHQIRVTLAHLGHPVVGDRTYGQQDRADRLMLHAHELHVGDAHAQSPSPADFDAVLASYRDRLHAP